jgi:MFS family permease
MADDIASLGKRFRPLYGAAFLQGIIFWYSIEKLFMKSIGFDDKHIALVIIIVSVLTIITSTPIGILADRWSRTGVLVLGSLEMGAASLIGGLSHGFWTYLISACFAGLFMASFQGSYDSIVYDTLKEERVAPKLFNCYYSRLRFYDGVALIVGSLSSALIVHFIDIRAAYFLTIPFAIATIVMLIIFKEPKEHKIGKQDLLLTHIGATVRAVFHSKPVMLIGLNLILISIVSALLLDFDQLWFIALSLPLVLYGPFDGILLSSFSVGGFLSERLHSKKVLLLMAILSLLSAFMLMIHEVYIIVVGQAIILTSMVVYSITFERFLHDNLASRVRVGSASFVSTVSSIIFLPVAYLTGRISDQSSIFHASWLVVFFLIILLATSSKVLLTHRYDS